MDAMSGLAVSEILGIAVSTDWKTRRIPNRLILAGILWGAILRFLTGGPVGMAAGLLHSMMTVVWLFLLFSLGVLGAGDVKLFSVLAVFLGDQTQRRVVLYSLLVGAVVSLARMIRNGQLFDRLFHLRSFYLDCLETRRLKTYAPNPQWGQDSYIHFSLCIAAGWVLAFLQAAQNGEVL